MVEHRLAGASNSRESEDAQAEVSTTLAGHRSRQGLLRGSGCDWPGTPLDPLCRDAQPADNSVRLTPAEAWMIANWIVRSPLEQPKSGNRAPNSSGVRRNESLWISKARRIAPQPDKHGYRQADLADDEKQGEQRYPFPLKVSAQVNYAGESQ
jgi:hypothetical protein